MNRKLLFIAIILLVFPLFVYAGDCDKYACIKCVYDNCTMEVESDGTKAELTKYGCTASTSYEQYSYSISAENFVNKTENKLSCPKGFTKEVGTVVYGRTVNILVKFVEDGASEPTKIEYNGLPLFKEETKGKAYINCDYEHNIHIWTDGTTATISGGDPSYGNKVTGTVDATRFLKDGKLFCAEISIICYDRSGSTGCTVSDPGTSETSYSKKSSGEEASSSEDIGVAKEKISDKKTSTQTSANNENRCGDVTTGREECIKYGVCKWKNGKCLDKYLGEDVCDNVEGAEIKRVLRTFGYLLLIAKVAVPLLIIGFGTFDLYKAIIGSDEKALGKQTKQLIIRVIAGLIIFFLPNIVYAIISNKLSTTSLANFKCIATCVLNPSLCYGKSPEIKTQMDMPEAESTGCYKCGSMTEGFKYLYFKKGNSLLENCSKKPDSNYKPIKETWASECKSIKDNSDEAI